MYSGHSKKICYIHCYWARQYSCFESISHLCLHPPSNHAVLKIHVYSTSKSKYRNCIKNFQLPRKLKLHIFSPNFLKTLLFVNQNLTDQIKIILKDTFWTHLYDFFNVVINYMCSFLRQFRKMESGSYNLMCNRYFNKFERANQKSFKEHI